VGPAAVRARGAPGHPEGQGGGGQRSDQAHAPLAATSPVAVGAGQVRPGPTLRPGAPRRRALVRVSTSRGHAACRSTCIGDHPVTHRLAEARRPSPKIGSVPRVRKPGHCFARPRVTWAGRGPQAGQGCSVTEVDQARPRRALDRQDAQPTLRFQDGTGICQRHMRTTGKGERALALSEEPAGARYSVGTGAVANCGC